MRAEIERWADSLGLRIPDSLAAETALWEGREVDLTAEEGCLVVRPVRPAEFTLDGLLSRISPGNLHRSIGFGRAVGDEFC